MNRIENFLLRTFFHEEFDLAKYLSKFHTLKFFVKQLKIIFNFLY